LADCKSAIERSRNQNAEIWISGRLFCSLPMIAKMYPVRKSWEPNEGVLRLEPKGVPIQLWAPGNSAVPSASLEPGRSTPVRKDVPMVASLAEPRVRAG
jgi:hypothetical protein